MSSVRRPALPVRRASAAPETGVLPIAGIGALAVSSRVVRERVAAWVATRPASSRPDAVLWRDGVAVAFAVAEAAGAGLAPERGVPAPPWETAVVVPPVPDDLVRRSALRPERVRAAVDVLVSARVLDLLERTGDEWLVRPNAAAFEDAPVLAAVAWDTVRARLGPASVSAAALAVVRELARATTPGARAARHFERLTFLDVAGRTGYGKSALRTALAACTAAGLLDVRTRERVASYFRLLPAVFEPIADGDPAVAAAFGDPMDPTSPTVPDRRPPRPERPLSERVRRAPSGSDRAEGRPAVRVAPREDTVAASSTPSAVEERSARTAPASTAPASTAPGVVPASEPAVPGVVIEVNGVPIPLPSGARPTLERDAAGTYWYRVGAMRVGPIAID